MLKISNIRLPADSGTPQLRKKALAMLKIPEKRLISLKILKKSIDSRDKNDVHFVYSCLAEVAGEKQVLKGCDKRRVSPYIPEVYIPPIAAASSGPPPVIVGAGPAGLFCALTLCKSGIKPVLLEQGRRVEDRVRDVEAFWNTGRLDTLSNVQFGEGGAGAFSDGKLNTGINDRRLRFVLEELYKAGAPEEILYMAAPHAGTDRLRIAVKNLRETLLDMGCDIRFEHKMADIAAENGRIRAVSVLSGGKTVELGTESLVVAPGHSARDTFEMLLSRGVLMQQKQFSVGVRIEHSQKMMNMAQYGDFADRKGIPAASYKLSCHLQNGRGVYSFCVCPGGVVVASASEAGGVVTNGMSEFSRDGENINGAILVSVGPGDFGVHPLGGLYFQRELEKKAFLLGGSDYRAPAQLVGDFLESRKSTGFGSITPTYRPGTLPEELRRCLPGFVADSLAEGIRQFGERIRGFDNGEAVLTAVESRSSSPVRLIRDAGMCSSIKGLYPCGEGAGWAGGIMSSAVDGVKCAEAIIAKG